MNDAPFVILNEVKNDKKNIIKRHMKTAHTIPLLIAGIALPATGLYAQKAPRKAAKTPNIIYILADDLGYGDLSCYGQRYFTTPNIDAMAAQGMRFTQHYAGCTVSAPSRASLITGLHTGHTPIRGNASEKTPYGNFDASLPAEYKTVAEYLKEKNYATACVGKWGMGGPGTQGHPNNQGFDYFYGHLSQLAAHFHFPEFLWENEEKIMLGKKYYCQDLFVEKAFNFIRANKENPFFLYFSVTIPHAELSIAEDYLEYYKQKYVEKPYAGNGHYCPQPDAHGAFAAMINKLDSDVGALRKLLKELGLDENTLIIFTSDNGPHIEGGADPDFFGSRGGLRGIKRDLYEGGIRVPMIACWPGTIKEGSEADNPSAFWDFLPTACELAGVKVNTPTDGISFLPTLKGKKQTPHSSFYWEFHENGGSQAVRMGNWKAVHLNVMKDMAASIELYDLSKDMAETNNVAAQHPGIVKQILDIMNTVHREDGKWPFIKK